MNTITGAAYSNGDRITLSNDKRYEHCIFNDCECKKCRKSLFVTLSGLRKIEEVAAKWALLSRLENVMCYNAPVGDGDTSRNGLFEKMEKKMNVAAKSRPDKWASVGEFAEDLGLEPARVYMLAGNGAGVRLHQCHWPRKQNCTRYDRWVYVLEFSDGTFAPMLDTCGLTKGQIKVSLLDMAEASTP